MAQLNNVGQGKFTVQPLSPQAFICSSIAAVFGPLAATAMLLLSLVFALLGIKFWGFRRRLRFDRTISTTTAAAATSQQQLQPPQYAAYESQVSESSKRTYNNYK